MSFMKQDINFNLLFLLGIVVAATVLLTLYFTHSMSNVTGDYNQLETDLDLTSDNLTLTAQSLQICEETMYNFTLDLNESKTIEEKSREEYNKIYEQTETELTTSQQTLKETKDQLDMTTGELKTTTANLNQKIADLSQAEKEVKSLTNENEDLKQKIDDIENCADNDNLDCVKGLVG